MRSCKEERKSLKSLPPLGLYLILILGLGYGFSVNGLILSWFFVDFGFDFELIFFFFWGDFELGLGWVFQWGLN